MPSDPVPLLSVIIPAYNEAERIVPTLERLQAYLGNRPHRSEIVVVDDGSHDGTGDVVRSRPAAAAPCRVVSNGSNRGKGFSVRHGVREARGTYLLVSDADLSTPIEEIETLLPLVERDGFALAMGSRALPESRIEIRQTWVRERMGKTFNLIIRGVTGLPFHDTQCGFKLMRRESILPVFEACRIDGFCYDVELIYLALRWGLRVTEVPVRWLNSYPSRVRMVRDSARMLFDAVRIVAIHSGRSPRRSD
jgi:dolichyl-phosphate beta-glucosyltransferase